MTNYILKQNDDMAVIKTDLDEDKLLKLVEQTKQHENYSQAYFVEIIEYLEEELNKLSCHYEVINLSNLETIDISSCI